MNSKKKKAENIDVTLDRIAQTPEMMRNILDAEIQNQGKVTQEVSLYMQRLKILEDLQLPLEKNSAFMTIAIPEKKEKAIKVLKNKYKNYSKDDLLDGVAIYQLRFEAERELFLTYEKIAKLAVRNMIDAQKRDLMHSRSKTMGRNQKFKENQNALDHAYTVFMEQDKGAILKGHLAFEKVLKKLYPKPPYIPKPRILKKGNLSTEQRAGELEDLERDSWAKSTIHTFYSKKQKLLKK